MELSDTESIKEENDPVSIDINRINTIKNKDLRRAQIKKYRQQIMKSKKEQRKKKKMSGEPKKVPKTIDNMRESDATMLALMEEEERDEINAEFDHDEMNSYFMKSYEPKVLITFSDNPTQKSGVKTIIKKAGAKGYTDIIVINENQREPNFRMSYKEISEHRPEVILNNFSTHLGNTVARMLAALFHYDPEFKGRRAVTFHNQRKVKLRELGPRFTLKLRSLQRGTFDSKTGEYEWIITDKRHDMETSRRRFYL
ncbi:putative ribosome production factor 1 [Blattella germanica]|nr:putative ribosome production factor 1 [Blattella germanica]